MALCEGLVFMLRSDGFCAGAILQCILFFQLVGQWLHFLLEGGMLMLNLTKSFVKSTKCPE
jgi:hypothetical protein